MCIGLLAVGMLWILAIYVGAKRGAQFSKPSKLKGVKKSENTKKKMSISQKGRFVSEEAKEKMSIARKKYWEKKRNGLQY